MVLASVCLLGLLSPPADLQVLFIGNSHTWTHDVPAMVKSLLTSDGSQRRVEVKLISGSFLNDIAQQPEALREIRSGRWNRVVLQGAMLSSSHKHTYSQEGAIQLARAARDRGIPAFLFAEWPRRGWKETGYILGIYGEIAKASGAQIIPVCKAWDAALVMNPKLALWGGDGNHARLPGSFLAALTIANRLGGGESRWKPVGLDEGTAGLLRRASLP